VDYYTDNPAKLRLFWGLFKEKMSTGVAVDTTAAVIKAPFQLAAAVIGVAADTTGAVIAAPFRRVDAALAPCNTLPSRGLVLYRAFYKYLIDCRFSLAN